MGSAHGYQPESAWKPILRAAGYQAFGDCSVLFGPEHGSDADLPSHTVLLVAVGGGGAADALYTQVCMIQRDSVHASVCEGSKRDRHVR